MTESKDRIVEAKRGEELAEERDQLDIQMRTYDVDDRGPYGETVVIVQATDSQGGVWYATDPLWVRVEGSGPVPELLSIRKRPLALTAARCPRCGSTELEERVLVAAGPHFSPWPRVTTAIEEDDVTTAKGELRAKVCLACGAVELTERT